MTSDCFDLAAIRAKLPDVIVDWSPSLASTNDQGLEAARSRQPAPRLVLADRQTQGRGRGENQWWSSEGSLTFSMVLDAEAIGLELQHWPLASLAVGLAVCQAIEGAAPGAPLSVKWPNDVFLDERKLAGILVETSPTPPRLVIGVGLNVNNRFEQAPADVQSRSESMRQFFGRSFDLTDVLVQTVRTISAQVHNVALDRPATLSAWRQRCLLTGRHVEIQRHDRLIAGVCQGIDNDGALIVSVDGVVHRIVAGVVQRFQQQGE